MPPTKIEKSSNLRERFERHYKIDVQQIINCFKILLIFGNDFLSVRRKILNWNFYSDKNMFLKNTNSCDTGRNMILKIYLYLSFFLCSSLKKCMIKILDWYASIRLHQHMTKFNSNNLRHVWRPQLHRRVRHVIKINCGQKYTPFTCPLRRDH